MFLWILRFLKAKSFLHKQDKYSNKCKASYPFFHLLPKRLLSYYCGATHLFLYSLNNGQFISPLYSILNKINAFHLLEEILSRNQRVLELFKWDSRIYTIDKSKLIHTPLSIRFMFSQVKTFLHIKPFVDIYLLNI